MTPAKLDAWVRKIVESYAFPVQGKVIKGWEEGSQFLCDCLALELDGSESSVQIPAVKVPKLWGKLSAGAIVNIGFYRGNQHYPFVMSVEGVDYPSPVDLNTFLGNLLDLVAAMKTVGSPAAHTLSPDDIAKVQQMKAVDLLKLLG